MLNMQETISKIQAIIAQLLCLQKQQAQIKDYSIKMLYYNINSLNALNKLKKANCYALKEANIIALRSFISNLYNFLKPKGVVLDLNMLAFIKAQVAL